MGGCSNAARTGSSSFHPASLLRLLRNRPRRSGVRFSAGTGLLPRQSADPATSWRSNTSRHHVSGRTPSGCLLLQATLRGVVLVERRPVQFRTIAGIHRPALGELARRPRSRVSQPLNTADRPTSHNEFIMQRGPLLQPLRSTELVLSGPPRAHPSGCVQPFRLRRAQHRQAHRGSHCLSFVGLNLFSLVPFHRRSKPILRTGFPLGVCSAKASLLSHGEAPLRPASPSADTPHPFSPKLSRFRACSFVAAETAPAPRFSQSLLRGVSLQSRTRRKPEPGIPAKGFLWAQLFRSHEQPFLAGESLSAHTVTLPSLSDS